MEKLFKIKNQREELDMLLSDDNNFLKTKEYLKPLIKIAIERLKTKNSIEIENNILNQIPIAAKRFLENKKNIEDKNKFSVYFTWYIHETIKNQGLLRKITKKSGLFPNSTDSQMEI